MDEGSQPTKGHMLSNRSYDVLKLFTLVILPGLGTLYVALAAIWGLPSAEQVSATVVAVVAFLGLFIKASDKSYNNSDQKFAGTINVLEDDKRKVFSLELNGDPEDIEKQNEVSFKVNSVA